MNIAEKLTFLQYLKKMNYNFNREKSTKVIGAKDYKFIKLSRK